MSIQSNINQVLGIGAALVSAKKIADAKAEKAKVTEAKAAEKAKVTEAKAAEKAKVTEAKAAEKAKVTEAKEVEPPHSIAVGEEKKQAGVRLKRIKKRLKRMQAANDQAKIKQEVKIAQKNIIETNINRWGSL